jgi:hypothetical protein
MHIRDFGLARVLKKTTSLINLYEFSEVHMTYLSLPILLTVELFGKFLGKSLDNESFGVKNNVSVRSTTFHKCLRKASVMETTQVSQGSQVKDGSTLNGETAVKQPEEVRAVTPNVTVGNLESSFKDALDQIRHCDEQAGLWFQRKQELQAKVNETLASIQKQVGGSEAVSKEKKTRTRIDKNATVPALIRTFLEKEGSQRTKDIRKFLLANGRKTNPGVALSRMLKNGDLKSTERGVYRIA